MTTKTDPVAAFDALDREFSKLTSRRSDLESRRADLAAKSEALSSERKEATIDGAAFDKDAEITTLRSDIGVIDEAVAELDSRINSASPAWAMAKAAARGAGIVDSVRSHVPEYLTTVAEIEAHARGLVAGLLKLNKVNRAMATDANSVTQTAFDDLRLHHRMSDRVSRAFSGLSEHGTYGTLAFRPEHPRDEDWVAEERVALESAFAEVEATIRNKLAVQAGTA